MPKRLRRKLKRCRGHRSPKRPAPPQDAAAYPELRLLAPPPGQGSAGIELEATIAEKRCTLSAGLYNVEQVPPFPCDHEGGDLMLRKRVCLLASAALVATLCIADSASASLAYSFETGLDGFFGLGATASAETSIGVTDGTTSLKYVAGAAGFVGVRTQTVIPADLNNPPGVISVQFDMTIVEIPVGLTFADIGVTVFGDDFDNGTFGVQNQFTDTVSITSLGVGQHQDLVIDLDSEFFTGESFNQIFGDDVSDLDVASAFQFYISKTSGVSATVYIDNVRLVLVPEPATGLMSAALLVGLAARRRKLDRYECHKRKL
ncbi:MAG: PEP-CTERM sorting domain-containing protein [Phycisphaeraceae bacterium]